MLFIGFERGDQVLRLLRKRSAHPDEVVGFAGIGDEVVGLGRLREVIDGDHLPAVGADGPLPEPVADARLGDDGASVGDAARHRGHERTPLPRRRDRHAREVQEGRREVDAADLPLHDSTGLQSAVPRHADQERHLQLLVVEVVAVPRKAALPEALAVVARDDDDRVVPTRRRGDGREQVRDRVVAVGDLAVVGVERPPADLRGRLLRLHRPGVSDRPLPRRVERPVIGRGRAEVPVRVHVEEKEEDRLRRIPAPQPVETHLRQHQPLRVAGRGPHHPGLGRQGRRVVVPQVEALAVAEAMVRHAVRGNAHGGVARAAQRLGEGNGLLVVRKVRHHAPVLVGGQRGEERHHGGDRPGAAGDDGLEADAFRLRETVDVRRRAAFVAVAAEMRRADAVDENEKNIGVRERRFLPARRHRRREKRRAQQNRPCLHCLTSFFAFPIQMRRCDPSSGTVTLKTPFDAALSSRSPVSASVAASGTSHFGSRYENA